MFSDMSAEWSVPQKGIKLDKQLFHFSKRKKSPKKSHENPLNESNLTNSSLSSTMVKSFEQLDTDELQKKKRIRKRKNKNKFKNSEESPRKDDKEADDAQKREEIVVDKKKRKRKLKDDGESPSPKKRKKKNVDIPNTESIAKNASNNDAKKKKLDTSEPVGQASIRSSNDSSGGNVQNKKKKKMKSLETETDGKRTDSVHVSKNKDDSEAADDQCSKMSRYREKKRRRKERLRALKQANAGVENSSQNGPRKGKMMDSKKESKVGMSPDTETKLLGSKQAKVPLKKQKRPKSKSEKMEKNTDKHATHSSPPKSNKNKSERSDIMESFPRSPLLKSETKKIEELSTDKSNTTESGKSLGSKKKFSLGLKKILENENKASGEKRSGNGKNKEEGLKGRMEEKLSAARFRFLNEQLYTTTGAEAFTLFHQDPDSYQVYHRGYSRQVEKWPTNPCDVIIQMIRNMPGSPVVADFGCGEAKIARSLPNKVHSFDLKAACDDVIECNMAKVPLPSSSVDVSVFCLSLMGTDLVSFLAEGNRVLKQGGCLLIAEVRSRFADLKHFLKGVQKLGFKLQHRDLSNKMFVLLEFGKVASVDRSRPLPYIDLSPCLYKKR